MKTNLIVFDFEINNLGIVEEIIDDEIIEYYESGEVCSILRVNNGVHEFADYNEKEVTWVNVFDSK